MTDFSKIIEKAKELETKMKESQEKIKNINATGISGGNSVKITLNGEGEIVEISETSQLFSEPQHPYTKILIDSFPQIGDSNKLTI